jgi:hypothetical protein
MKLPAASFDMVKIHPRYQSALENNDVFFLWAIIAIGGSEMQIAIAESNLRELSAQKKDFIQFTREFQDLLKIAKDLGSTISKGQVVSAYLKAPLERRVLMLLNSLASDFPTTIEEAVATMTGAWRTEVTRGALKTSVSTNDEPAMLSAAAFESTFEDGKKFVFNCNEGLYECEVETQKWNPCFTGQRFNTEQKKRAKIVYVRLALPFEPPF